MTDIPDWVLKEAAKRCDWHPSKTLAQMRGYLSSSASFTALCRAIEQHEAFRQKVSDAARVYEEMGCPMAWEGFEQFIIPAPKPDPLVEALHEVDTGPEWDSAEDYCNKVRAALDALGFEIREKGH